MLQKPRAERTAEEQREVEEEDAAAAQELFCVCQQPDDPEAPRDFVQCDKCEQWFHPECVNTTTQVEAATILLSTENTSSESTDMQAHGVQRAPVLC